MIPKSTRNRLPKRILLFLCLFLPLLFLLLPAGNPWKSWGESPLPSEEIVRLVHFSDVHYESNGADTSWRLLKDSPVLLQAALQEVREMPGINFLLFSGDSVNRPRAENFTGFFQLLRRENHRPFYMALGNHDVGVKPHQTRQETIDAFRRHGGKNCFPSSDSGWYSISLQSWLKLIVLDGTTDEKVSSNGFIPQKELDWLALELAHAKQSGQMVIVASHFPLVEPFQSKSHRILHPDADRLLALLKQHENVVAYFAGHYHSARIAKHDGIYYITSPALVEYPNAFRVVTISNHGRLSLAWHQTKMGELSHKSKERSPFHRTALGNPGHDHTLTDATLRFLPSQQTMNPAISSP